MYFEPGVKCGDNWRFCVPHREKPMKAKHLIRKFPAFAAEFDGSSKECCLSWYYTFDKAAAVFELRDPDAEQEVAELMGVSIVEFAAEDLETSTGSTKSLTKEEIEAVREHLADIRNGLKIIDGSK